MSLPPYIDPDRRTPRFECVALLLAALLLGVSTGAALVQGIDLHDILRDPTSVTQAPLHVGFVSLVGVLFWIAGAAVCWFSGVLLLGRRGDQARSRMLLSVAALTTVLGLDDLFLMHETILPSYLGVPEKLTLASYGLATATVLVVFRAEIFALGVAGLAWALALFALSLGVDLVQHSIEPFLGHLRILLEDGAKFLGIAAWNSYFAHAGWRSIRARLARDELADGGPATTLLRNAA